MKIVRIVVLTLDPAPKVWEEWVLECGPIHMHTEPLKQSGEKSLRMLAIAGIDAGDGAISIANDNCVEVSPNVRESLELALTNLSNMIAVSEVANVRLASPDPCIALMPESDSELQWLNASNGFRFQGVARAQGNYRVNFNGSVVNGLADRLDGVRLLAEALACEHPLGRYRELVRFFELAFSRPVTQIDKKLSQFLSENGCGYSRQEVAHWIELRHPAVHGDNGREVRLTYSMDAILIVGRMLQAAYDVLMNKLQWHDASKERRELWTPATATMDMNGGLRFTQGKENKITFAMFDEYHAFPSALGGIRLPETFWYRKYVDSGMGASGRVAGAPIDVGLV